MLLTQRGRVDEAVANRARPAPEGLLPGVRSRRRRGVDVDCRANPVARRGSRR